MPTTGNPAFSGMDMYSVCRAQSAGSKGEATEDPSYISHLNNSLARPIEIIQFIEAKTFDQLPNAPCSVQSQSATHLSPLT